MSGPLATVSSIKYMFYYGTYSLRDSVAGPTETVAEVLPSVGELPNSHNEPDITVLLKTKK